MTETQQMKDDIQSLLKNFTEADFALLIIAGKDKDGHKRDGLILNGRLDKAIVATALNMVEEEDFRSLVVGAAGLYVSHREELKEIAEQNSKIVEL